MRREWCVKRKEEGKDKDRDGWVGGFGVLLLIY